MTFHANVPALEAVLAEVERAGVDWIVIGGDVVPGPVETSSDHGRSATGRVSCAATAIVG
jgi:3',5'-cyclic AMP phosphodiesterase CpdA